jgi:hypothetical protein
MFNAIPNPKKEFTVNYPLDKVKDAVLKLENPYCVIEKIDEILNEIVFHDKDKLGFGYHVSFAFEKVSEDETKVVIEVSKRLTALNTSSEVSIANNKLKRFANEFSSSLSGKPIEKPSGCASVLALLIIVFTVICYNI